MSTELKVAQEEKTIEYAVKEVPELGKPEKLADEFYWIRMPLPFSLNHINLWTQELSDGWAQFDTGYASPETQELWEDIFSGFYNGKPMSKLLITHFHPDHMGLVRWLTDRWNILMNATEAEWLTGRIMTLDQPPELGEVYRDFYTKAGLDKEIVDELTARRESYRERATPVPTIYNRLHDRDVVTVGNKKWQVHVGYGHSPEHACFHCAEDKLFIAGDMVLSKISPNVSVWPNKPEANPLKTYLDSLARYKEEIDNDVMVLPSHGKPFYGLHERIASLTKHHIVRLTRVLEACKEPLTATEIMHQMFSRKLKKDDFFFAIGEALSHIHYLIETGEIIREPGSDGVYRYTRV